MYVAINTQNKTSKNNNLLILIRTIYKRKFLCIKLECNFLVTTIAFILSLKLIICFDVFYYILLHFVFDNGMRIIKFLTLNTQD